MPIFGKMLRTCIVLGLGTGLSTAGHAAGAPMSNCYDMEVKTQDVGGAGTDANIKMTARGTTGLTDTVVLNPLVSGNAFERDDLDSFQWCSKVGLGAIEHISLYSDGAGAGSAWDIAYVAIQPPGGSSAIRSVFNFNTELDDEETISRNCATCPSPSEANDFSYLDMTFFTGTRGGAGTDANVFVIVTGSLGKSTKIALNQRLSGNAFENGDRDNVVLWLDEDIGRPVSIGFELEGAYAGNDWYLDKVVIKDKMSNNNEFFIESWLTTSTKLDINGTFTADYLNKPLDQVGSASSGQRTTFEVQVNHNLGGTSDRKTAFTFTAATNRALELMDSTGKTNTQSLSVTAGTSDANLSNYKFEVTAGLEFSQSTENQIGQALSHLSQIEYTQDFDIPPDTLLFVECTWVYPQSVTLLTDGINDFYLRALNSSPKPNCGPLPFGPGDTMSVSDQLRAQLLLSNWPAIKARAISAGIVMGEGPPQPDFDREWQTSTYGVIDWPNKWYDKPDNLLSYNKIRYLESEGKYALDGTWGRRDTDGPLGGFSFVFTGACNFDGHWWYEGKEGEKVAWSGSCS